MKTRTKPRARATATTTSPRLLEIRLPAGDCIGIDVDYPTATGHTKYDSRSWLGAGWDGIRFIGAGIGQTHLRPGWDWDTVIVNRHGGIVQFESLTLHAGRNRGMFFGLQNNARETPNPKCQLRLIDVEGIVDQPGPDGARTKWLLFGYNTDVYLQDVTLDATLASEHASYWHGFAKLGLKWVRVKVLGSGSQGCKVRSDITETAPVVGTLISLSSCTFKNYGQPWSTRGGAGFVVESGASDIIVEKCAFWGGQDNEHSHAIALSSEAMSYDTAGQVGTTGFGNGHVLLRDIAVSGRSLVDWNNSVIRCARNSGSMKSAKSFTLTRSGVWGPSTLLQLGEIPAGTSQVTQCNTPALRSYCGHALGMSVDVETAFATSQRRIPLSEGLVR